MDATPEGSPMVDVETERRGHDTRTKYGELTSRTSHWAKVGRSGTLHLHEDEGEDEYQPQTEVEQEMAEVAEAMGQPEQEAFQEYLAEQREGEDEQPSQAEQAEDAVGGHAAVENVQDMAPGALVTVGSQWDEDVVQHVVRELERAGFDVNECGHSGGKPLLECRRVATDGGQAQALTHDDVEQALDAVLPHYGRFDMVPEDHAQVAEGRSDQGWIEVRAEASLDLAMSFSAALQEELGGSVVVEPAGMGVFTVVDY